MDHSINNPHDKFAKEMLSHKEFAIVFLTEYLPSSIKGHLNLESLTLSTNSFINDSLEERFSDIVFRVQMKEESKHCFVSILIENKANPSKYVSVQILEYLSSAYAAQVKAKEKLHPVIPLLYYQGKEKWKVESLAELLSDYPKELMSFVPNYKSVFIELFGLSDKDINQLENNLLQTYLTLQKFRFDPDQLVLRIVQIFNRMDLDTMKNYFNLFVVYMYQMVELTETEFLQKLNDVNSNIKSEIMTTYELLIAKGEAKGLAKGKAEGKAEGEQMATKRMVIAAFQNNIPLETIAKMAGLTIEQIKDILKM